MTIDPEERRLLRAFFGFLLLWGGGMGLVFLLLGLLGGLR